MTKEFMKWLESYGVIKVTKKHPPGKKQVIKYFFNTEEEANNFEQRHLSNYKTGKISLIENTKKYVLPISKPVENILRKRHKSLVADEKLLILNKKTLLSDMLPDIDRVLDEKLIYPIQYPKNTFFLRDVFNVPAKRKAKEIREELEKNIVNVAIPVRDQLLADKQYFNKQGKCIFSPQEINNILYERIYEKCAKQLNLSYRDLDIITNELAHKARFPGKDKELGEEIKSSLPLYLYDYKGYVINEHSSIADSMELINNLHSQIIQYRNTPGKEEFLAKCLDVYIIVHNNLECLKNYNEELKKLDARHGKITRFEQELSKVLEQNFEKEFQSHNKSQPANKLTNYEEKCIEAIELEKYLTSLTGFVTNVKAYGRSITNCEKQLIADFYESILGNTKFAGRISKILKTDSLFVIKNIKLLNEVSELSYETKDLTVLSQSVNKLIALHKSIEDNPDYKPLPSEQLTKEEYVKIVKLPELKRVLENLKNSGILNNSNKLEKLYNFIDKPSVIIQNLKPSNCEKMVTDSVKRTMLNDLEINIDKKLEEKLVYPIKYLQNTSFIRKLLGWSVKRKASEIQKDLEGSIVEIAINIRKELQANTPYLNENGNFIYSPERVNSLIYERIYEKCAKQLNLSYQEVSIIIDQAAIKAMISNQDNKLSTLIANSPPLHLVDFKACDFDAEMYTLSDNIKFINYLHAQIIEYKNKPGKEEFLAKCLDSYIIVHNKLSRIEKFGEAIIKLDADHGDIKKYEEELSKVQDQIIQKELKSHSKNQSYNKLTTYEEKCFKAMNLIGKVDDVLPYRDLTNCEKKLVADFYENAIGNNKFNNRINNILKSDNIFVKSNRDAIIQVSKFSFKTKDLGKLKQLITKLEILYTKVDMIPNYVPNDSEKITLEEFAKTSKFAGLKLELECLVKAGVPEHSKKLSRLYMNINRADKLVSDIESKVEAQIEYKSGDFIIDVLSKFRVMKQLNLGFLDEIKYKIMASFTRYAHTAISRVNDEDRNATKMNISHISDKYEKNAYSGRNIMVSESFRVLPDKLLSMSAEMKTKYMDGMNLKTEEDFIDSIRYTYEDICFKLLDNRLKITEIKNDDTKQFKAGLADFLYKGHTDYSTGGIKKWAEKVLEKGGGIPDKDSNNEVICSEFVAKVIVIALVRLDQKLNEFLTLPHNQPPIEFIKLPFNEYEKLGAVHPERLIKELSKRGCIEKVQQPAIISQILR